MLTSRRAAEAKLAEDDDSVLDDDYADEISFATFHSS
jgi:hypothetical protein